LFDCQIGTSASRHRSLTPVGETQSSGTAGTAGLADPVITSLQAAFLGVAPDSDASYSVVASKEALADATAQSSQNANERALAVLSQAVESLRITVETQAASQENLQQQLSRLQQQRARSVPSTPEPSSLPEAKLRELAKRQTDSPVFTALAKVQTVVNSAPLLADADSVPHSSDKDSSELSNADASSGNDPIDEVYHLPYSHIGDSVTTSSTSQSTRTASVSSHIPSRRTDVIQIYEKMIAQLQTQLPTLERTVQQQLSDNFRLSVDKEEAMMALTRERQTVAALRDTCERYQQESELLSDRLDAQQQSNDSLQHSLAQLDALHAQVICISLSLTPYCIITNHLYHHCSK
jgi:flagellar biosynthesis chaperone FliJ